MPLDAKYALQSKSCAGKRGLQIVGWELGSGMGGRKATFRC